MQARIIVGVCGGSGAGKGHVIHDHLLPALGSAGLVLEHDWYYHEYGTLLGLQGVKSRAEINYDIPQAYENGLLIEHLRALKRGESIHIHKYQKGASVRSPHALHLEPREVVVVDGMMILSVPELVAELDVRGFVEATEPVRLHRRIRRDLAFASEEESRLRFDRDVMPAHRRFVGPSIQLATFVIQNEIDGAAAKGMHEFISAVIRKLHETREEHPCPATAASWPHWEAQPLGS